MVHGVYDSCSKALFAEFVSFRVPDANVNLTELFFSFNFTNLSRVASPKTKECFNIIRNLVAFNFIGPSFNNAVSRARDIINIIAIKSNWHVVRAVHDADDLT